MATDPVAEAADALYALVPEEFTAARNARAADARSAGEPALAKAIGALRRPSPSAWIVNRLARDEPDRLGDLVGLGGELADAQAAGDGRALGALVAERRELIGDLMRLAVSLTDAADRSPSRAVLDEVEQTLVAASVSAEAGAAVASGRLVRALRAVGVDVDVAGAVGGGEPGPPRRLGRRPSERAEGRADAASRDTSRTDRADRAAEAARRERERLEEAARQARERADDDEHALAEASARLERAERRFDDLEAERDELELRLSQVRDELRPAEREVRIATRARESANAEAARSARARDEAQAALDR
ncbi:transposase [Agromyces binzhouensis]|uniref:transposase n=1 Tax=Agromyces binzhouensis TaxID=1817495 RepID=UPI0036372E5B